MIKIYSKILFLLLFSSQIIFSQGDASREKVKDTCNLKFTYRGIEIVTYPQKNMFPDSWMVNPVYARVSSLMKNNEDRAVKLIKKALDKYPLPVLEENLQKIYVLGHLGFYGMTYGGTYFENTLFMDVKDESLGYTADYVEKTFHHEFSSVLLNNYTSYFDSTEWLKGNVKSFKYGSGGVDAMYEGKSSLTWEKKYHEKGFLNQYSTASVEEDFNEICGNLVTSTRAFWDVVDNYSLVKQKVKTAINFYHKIDKTFTEEYFRSLAN